MSTAGVCVGGGVCVTSIIILLQIPLHVPDGSVSHWMALAVEPPGGALQGASGH